MADFLASFNLGAQAALSSSSLPCDSVDDLQLHLRKVLDAKVTPNRAEHVSITMELRATVRFHLSLPERENGALEGLNGIDPSLGGTSLSEDQPGRQISRTVGANEALMNQPQGDPVLQTSIAKHIIAALGAIDGSDWAIRDLTREAQGWAFTYLCRNSYQVWSRQHAKSSSKSIVGEYSQRELDSVLSARPAFDCRGIIIIAFNRNSRLISVKYDHTPIHKTVTELSELFKPPPRELGPGAQKLLQQKTPKQKTPKQKTPRKIPGKRAQDEMGSTRKRKKKNNGESQPTAPVAVMDATGEAGPEAAAVLHLDSSLRNSASEPGDNQAPQQDGEQNNQGFNDYPQGLMVGDSSKPTNETQGIRATTQLPPGITFPVNITPAEANRRRDAAITMLSNAGVPPDSLSAEQFSIFSNQAPELQRESLNMLVKYGAERLRIVHPSAKDGSASGQANTSTTSNQHGQTTSQPTTSKELVPQSGGSSNEGTEQPATSGTPKTKTRARKNMGKSRNACFQCKVHKTKCPRERPTCSGCESRGETCEYAPQGLRKKKPKSEAVVVNSAPETEDDGQGDDADDDVEAEVEEPDDDNSVQPEEPPTSSYFPQMPVSNILAPPVEAIAEEVDGLPAYFQQSTGLAGLGHVDEAPAMQQHHVPADSRQTYETREPEPTQSMEHQPVPAATDASFPQRGWGQSAPPSTTRSHSRRTLPSEPRQETRSDTIMNTHTSSDATAGVSYTGQTNRYPNPYVALNPVAQIHDGMQRASALAQAAIQQQHQHSPTATAAMLAHARSSPSQAANVPRAKSRQSQRAQTGTPAADQSMGRGYPPPPGNPSHHTRSHSSANQNASEPGGTLNHGDQESYGTTVTAHRQTNRRPGHESFSQAQATSSIPTTVEPPSQNASAGMSLSSQAPSSMSTYQTSASDQWLGSRGGHDRSYNSTSTYNTQLSYTQPTAAKSSSETKSNYDLRGSTRSTRSNNSSFGQTQQSYSSYPSSSQHQQDQQSQQSQKNQMNNQQSSWYSFNSSNSNSFSAGNHASGYPWSGV